MSTLSGTYRWAVAALVIAASCASVGADAADLAAGQAKAKEVCAACHGEDGNSTMPDYPKLAGQHRDYLEKSLRDYKSGNRKNAIMAGMVGALTKEDIENLALYYGSRPTVLSSKF